MTMVVKELLQVIDALPEEDRLALDRAMARRLEKDWDKETSLARKIAKKRKITMATIDRVIEKRRYGK